MRIQKLITCYFIFGGDYRVLKKNYIFIIVFILLFAYIGFTSNHEVSNFYSNVVPGVVSPSKDYSLTFILLAVILIGAYILKKPLSRITGKAKDVPSDKSNNNQSTEQPSGEETSAEQPSGEEVAVEQPNEEVTNDSVSEQDNFESKLKDTYKVD